MCETVSMCEDSERRHGVREAHSLYDPISNVGGTKHFVHNAR